MCSLKSLGNLQICGRCLPFCQRENVYRRYYTVAQAKNGQTDKWICLKRFRIWCRSRTYTHIYIFYEFSEGSSGRCKRVDEMNISHPSALDRKGHLLTKLYWHLNILLISRKNQIIYILLLLLSNKLINSINYTGDWTTRPIFATARCKQKHS